MDKKVKEIIHLLSQDKRKSERVDLAVIVYYRFPGGLEWLGPFTSANISGHGISFILGEKIAERTELELKIVLPDEPQRPIKVKGKVIWIAPLQDRYRLGMQFSQMNQDDRRRFVTYICDSILASYKKDE